MALVIAAGIVCGGFLAAAARDGTFALDFRHAFLPAADRIVHGESPYPSALSAAALSAGHAFVYPPLSAEVLIPLTWVPRGVATALFTLALALALVATLRLVGVRDIRCYAAAFLWGPTLAALQTANLTLLLALATAGAWRLRDNRHGGPACTALAMAPKLLAWPLLAWAGGARRTGLAFRSLCAALFLTFLTWAAIGLTGLTSYPHVVHQVTRIESPGSYSVYALAREIGCGSTAADIVWLTTATALLVATVFVSRKDERRGFVLAVAASLAFAPIIWLHYFALLLVPLAIARPRFDAAWLLPVALLGASGTGNGGVIRTIMTLIVAATVVAASLAPNIGARELIHAARARLRTTIVRSA